MRGSAIEELKDQGIHYDEFLVRNCDVSAFFRRESPGAVVPGKSLDLATILTPQRQILRLDLLDVQASEAVSRWLSFLAQDAVYDKTVTHGVRDHGQRFPANSFSFLIYS